MRRKTDAYYTPDRCAAACVGVLSRHVVDRSAPIVEPSCGDGSFLRALAGAGYTDVTGYDLQTGYDYLQHDGVRPAGRHVVGNPPYRHAEAFVRRALSDVEHGGIVAYLLRLGFLESRRRLDLWERFPAREIVVFAERPSFTGDGRTDGCAYGFFIWRKGWSGGATIRVMSWR